VPGKPDVVPNGTLQAQKKDAVAQMMAERAAKIDGSRPGAALRPMRPTEALAVVLDLDSRLRCGDLTREAYDVQLTALRERQSIA
jgi:hypothetical protein